MIGIVTGTGAPATGVANVSVAIAPGIGDALENNKSWLLELREQRDNIVHFKSKVVVFGGAAPYQFAMWSAAGDEPTIETPEGGRRLVLTNVFEFAHRQTRSVLNFMHVDLVTGIEQYVAAAGMKYERLGISDGWMESPGVERPCERVSHRARTARRLPMG